MGPTVQRGWAYILRRFCTGYVKVRGGMLVKAYLRLRV